MTPLRHAKIRFISRRILQSCWLILLLIALNFTLIHLAPGDPVQLLAGQSGDAQYFEFVRAKFGLDQPLPVQLSRYLASVARGDLGFSLAFQQPVASLVFSRVPATLLLLVTALLLSTTLGVWLGVEAARRAHSPFDRAVTTLAAVSDAVPSFCVGQVALLVFAVGLNLFPAQGMLSVGQELSGPARWLDVLSHLILPAATLSIVQMALIVRLTRTQMAQVLQAEFIAAARARGLSERRVAYRHALPNAALPVITVIGNEFGLILSGAVLVETVFAWPGLGRLMIDAIALRDYPVLLGLALLVSIGVVVANLLTDVVYSLLDPRTGIDVAATFQSAAVPGNSALRRQQQTGKFAATFRKLMSEERTLPSDFATGPALKTSLAVLCLFLCLALFADLIAPRDPLKTSDATLRPPSGEFLFGTDDLGRDVFSGVVHGARTSLLIGFAVALLGSLVGSLVGALAGYFGGVTDELLMRVTELFLTPPRFFLALMIVAIFGSSFASLTIILSLTFWPVTARVIRAETLSLRERDFVAAARALGASPARILRREILPHLLPLIITGLVVKVGRVILLEAGLEFLGLGDQSRITWGYLLHNGQHFLRDAWWMAVFPLLALSLLLVAINLLGDELNRRLNPRAS